MLGVTLNEYLIYWIVGGGLLIGAAVTFIYYLFKGGI